MASPHDVEGDALVRVLFDEIAALRADVRRTTPERRLVTREEAAAMLAMSLRHWQRRVQPHVRIVRSGRLRLVPVAQLEMWIAENMDR